MELRAVTFDYWNTLIAETSEPFERRRTFWTEILLEAGHEAPEEALGDAFKAGWEHFQDRWKRNVQSTVVHVAEHAVTTLPFDVSPAVRLALVDAYWEASRQTPRALQPGAAELIGALAESGVVIGVICDVGIIPSGQLRAWLDDLGIHQMVAHYSFSDEVGVYKPSAEIFHHALGGLGVDGVDGTVHIGDLKRTDIVGARGIGMGTVRYTGARNDEDEGEEADHVVADLFELFEHFGLAPEGGDSAR